MIIATNLLRWQLVHGEPNLQRHEHGLGWHRSHKRNLLNLASMLRVALGIHVDSSYLIFVSWITRWTCHNHSLLCLYLSLLCQPTKFILHTPIHGGYMCRSTRLFIQEKDEMLETSVLHIWRFVSDCRFVPAVMDRNEGYGVQTTKYVFRICKFCRRPWPLHTMGGYGFFCVWKMGDYALGFTSSYQFNIFQIFIACSFGWICKR